MLLKHCDLCYNIISDEEDSILLIHVLKTNREDYDAISDVVENYRNKDICMDCARTKNLTQILGGLSYD